MAIEVTGGMQTMLVLAAGIKLAIYIGVAILAILIDMVSKKNEKRHIYGLIVMSVILLILGAIEFFHEIAEAYDLFPWLANHETLDLISHLLYILSFLGLLWFLWGVSKNIKAYR